MIFLLIMGIPIFILNNAPGAITGSVSIKQLINYLNLRTLYPSVGALNAGAFFTPSKTIAAATRVELVTKDLHTCSPRMYTFALSAELYCQLFATRARLLR